MATSVQVSPARRQGINEWFAQMPGSLLLESEVEVLNRSLPNLFGYYLLQVGRLGNADMLGASRVMHRMIVDIDGTQCPSPYATFRGTAYALPVVSDSIDVVVLPHVLEFEEMPHEALREVQRVLVPEGHVVIVGFNPWSLTGLWRTLLHRSRLAPWSGHFLGLSRLVDWLALLGFDVTQIDYLFYRPPFRNVKVMERLRTIERMGDKVAGSFGGGAYVLIGKKRVSTLTPIRPKWSTRRRMVSVGLVEPTTRVARSRSRAGGDDSPGGLLIRSAK